MVMSDLPSALPTPIAGPPPRPFNDLVGKREHLRVIQRVLLDAAEILEIDETEKDRLIKGHEGVDSLVQALDAHCPTEKEWRKFDIIDIFSPTALDPGIRTVQTSILLACDGMLEAAKDLRKDPSQTHLFRLEDDPLWNSSGHYFSKAIGTLIRYARIAGAAYEDRQALNLIQQELLVHAWTSITETKTVRDSQVSYRRILLDQALRMQIITMGLYLENRKADLVAYLAEAQYAHIKRPVVNAANSLARRAASQRDRQTLRIQSPFFPDARSM
ncbi:hypothetical protein JCM10908_006925 [Rhodotorula pacifica]|uniref:uncharacterized protein n=1 Tax=Rhodotorula pacifica TaxID=1495444 RepID=UPI0031747C4D